MNSGTDCVLTFTEDFAVVIQVGLQLEVGQDEGCVIVGAGRPERISLGGPAAVGRAERGLQWLRLAEAVRLTLKDLQLTYEIEREREKEKYGSG